MKKIPILIAVLLAASLTPKGLAASSTSEFTRPLFHLVIVDPSHALEGKQADFLANLDAAMEAWNQVIAISTPLDIEIHVENSGVGRLDAASESSHIAGHWGTRDVFEEGAAYKLRTGEAPQPGRPDILIRINPKYLADEVWIDPHPTKKDIPVPSHKVDLVSLLKHELGHAFGFQSFRDLKTAELPAGYMSLLDKLTIKRGGRFLFVGPNSQRVYGGPVPLTSNIESQNFAHYGNAGDPAALTGGLMGGVAFYYARRYEIGAVDIAILQDLGVPVRNSLLTAN